MKNVFRSRSIICGVLFLAAVCSRQTDLHAQVADTADPTAGNASDSTSVPDPKQGPLDMLGIQYVRVTAAHYFSPPASASLRAQEPDALKEIRAERALWNGDYYSILDNPLYHGATFVDLETQIRPHPGFFLTAGITAENRGISYGVDNVDNSVMLLRYHLGVDTSFGLLGQRFGIRASVGDTRDARVDEGLFFNHNDIQGAYIRLDWNTLRYSFVKVGDAFAGLGLNIDDADYHRVEIRDLPLPGGWRGSMSGGWFHHGLVGSAENFYWSHTPRRNLLEQVDLLDHGYTLSGSLATGDTLLRLYSMIALRDARESDYMMSRTAFVAGASGRFETDRLKLGGTAEYRYYGGLFNAGYRNLNVYYRNPDNNETWANTVGPHLYQLSWFERPFSQWAVFAEYQDLKDVTGWSFYGKGKWFFHDRFHVRAMVDLNYVVPENLDPFLYPFYDIGIGWEPFDNFSVVASATNKGMNLDKHYPTFYLYERPVPSIAFRWNVE